MCSVSAGDVAKPSALAILLDAQVQHGALVAVVHTGHTGKVALSLVGLHFVHDFGRQVLQYDVAVGAIEFLAIHQELLYTLSVPGVRAVVVDHDAWQFLHQFLHQCAVLQLEGVGIVHHGVVHHRHLGQLALHDGLGHDLGILAHQDVLHTEVARPVGQGHRKALLLVSDERYAQRVLPRHDVGHREHTVLLH